MPPSDYSYERIIGRIIVLEAIEMVRRIECQMSDSEDEDDPEVKSYNDEVRWRLKTWQQALIIGLEV